MQIRKITNHHDNNIRKWIHGFNENGTYGIISKKHNHILFRKATNCSPVLFLNDVPASYHLSGLWAPNTFSSPFI
ncbi:MAG TPA: hypothetical protein VIY08_15845 [Candidatus Nitrosocosmicus sp.]